MGLRLSPEKTSVCHIDDGLDFLGFRIQRQTQRGSDKRFIYSWPSKKAFASIKTKIKMITRQGLNGPLHLLLRRLNAALRGWTTYFRHGVSARTFNYLNHYTWHRVVGWLRCKHARASWKSIRRRYLSDGLVPTDEGVRLFNPATVTIIRYRYRGAQIPTPWTLRTETTATG